MNTHSSRKITAFWTSDFSVSVRYFRQSSLHVESRRGDNLPQQV